MSILNPTSGGGSPSYISGAEVFVDLSAQAGVSFPMTIAHVGRTIILYSSTDGQSFKLLPANTGGTLIVGKGLGFRVMPGSKPIRIFNAGTAGTDPILEAFLLPGADCALFLQSASVPSVAAGTWKGRGYGMFHGPVPVNIPNVIDAGADAGSAVLLGGTVDIAALNPNLEITRLSSTLYVVTLVPNAGTSIVVYAISYNHVTDTWAWGTPVTAFSSGNQWSWPKIIGLNSTTYAILAWEATAAKVSARAATVAGTVITQGTVIQSGAWSVTPTLAAAMSAASLVADSSTTFFWTSIYDNSHLGITHFSTSGTTLTQDGGATFTSFANGASPINGFSPSANNLDIALPSDGASWGVSRYNYTAGSVTSVFDRRDRFGPQGTAGVLWCADPINKIYYTSDGSIVARLVFNAGATDFTEEEYLTLPVIADVAAPIMVPPKQLQFLSDNEAIATADTANIRSLTLFDPTISLRARKQIAPGTSSNYGAVQNIIPAYLGWGQSHKSALGVDINVSIRRLAMYMAARSQSVAQGHFIFMQMFDLPRNYDQATA